jgi:hypothetical protein
MKEAVGHQLPGRIARRTTTLAPARDATCTGWEARRSVPAVSSEMFSFSPSAPLAGSANRGSAPIPVPKGTLKCGVGLAYVCLDGDHGIPMPSLYEANGAIYL